MKKLLFILVIICAISCKDKFGNKNLLHHRHPDEEQIFMFTVLYRNHHDRYPSYYIRELYYKHKDDLKYIDSLIYKTPKD